MSAHLVWWCQSLQEELNILGEDKQVERPLRGDQLSTFGRKLRHFTLSVRGVLEHSSQRQAEVCLHGILPPRWSSQWTHTAGSHRSLTILCRAPCRGSLGSGVLWCPGQEFLEPLAASGFSLCSANERSYQPHLPSFFFFPGHLPPWEIPLLVKTPPWHLIHRASLWLCVKHTVQPRADNCISAEGTQKTPLAKQQKIASSYKVNFLRCNPQRSRRRGRVREPHWSLPHITHLHHLSPAREAVKSTIIYAPSNQQIARIPHRTFNQKHISASTSALFNSSRCLFSSGRMAYSSDLFPWPLAYLDSLLNQSQASVVFSSPLPLCILFLYNNISLECVFLYVTLNI